ncbi:MAG: alpha/beta fold hydrolase [Kiritimatiellae bacterium]|nr:alpha/beta fold hydrolase [Kiritimatiellia bacterium]MDD5519381.1 alpha/beta fold hydrolase [Kiritimatiellia bacterium]
MNSRMIIITGWAHTAEDLSPLCSLLSPKYDIQTISTGKLFSMADINSQSLPPVSHYAKALQGLISRSSEPSVIVAWSMGALIAMEAITSLSLQINKLIIVSGTARFCASEDYPRGVPESNLRAMTVNITKKTDETLASFFRDAMFPETNNRQIVEQKIQRAMPLTIDCLRDGLVYLRQADLHLELSKIRVPTLIIHGREDKIIPVSAGEFLASNISNSRLVVHNDTGHTLILDHPALIAEDILSFVEA